MRFPAIPIRKPMRKSSAAEFMRRLVATPPVQQQRTEPPARQDLPADLDQRVRLVGEW